MDNLEKIIIQATASKIIHSIEVGCTDKSGGIRLDMARESLSMAVIGLYANLGKDFPRAEFVETFCRRLSRCAHKMFDGKEQLPAGGGEHRADGDSPKYILDSVKLNVFVDDISPAVLGACTNEDGTVDTGLLFCGIVMFIEKALAFFGRDDGKRRQMRNYIISMLENYNQ